MDWATRELAAHWPTVVVEEVLPPRHRSLLELKASFTQGGRVTICLMTSPPGDPHGMQRLTAAYHRAQKAASITNPHAVKILQVSSLGACLVVVTEWCEGRGLLEGKAEQRLDGVAAIGLIDGMAEGMEIYHAAGWVHGYLTTDSFLLKPDGAVLLADHGVLDVVTGEVPDLLEPERIYVAPEMNGREGEERQVVGDVYGLGVVAYELLTGMKPAGHFLKMPSQATGEGKWLDDVILRAIHGKPDLRIPSAAEFRTALAAKTLRVMELPGPGEKETRLREEREKKRPVAESGVTAAMRVQFIAIMIFSMTVIGVAIYFGIDRYKDQEETQVSMEQAVMVMGQIVAKMADGEGEMDLDALVDELAGASAEVALDASQEQLAGMEGVGSREEALALAGMVAGAFEDVEGPAADEIRGILEKLQEEDAACDEALAEADRARMVGDEEAEYVALEAALETSPNDPELMRLGRGEDPQRRPRTGDLPERSRVDETVGSNAARMGQSVGLRG